MPAGIAERLQEGRAEELRSVAWLEQRRVLGRRQQEPFELKHRRTGRKVVGGKIDGMVTVEGLAMIVEAKLVSTWAFDATETAEDLKGKWWSRKNVAQLNLYLLGFGLEWGLFMLSDGRPRKWLPPMPLYIHLA